MKSAIGSIWITGLVITFMLIFTGYLAVTISYSSTIKSKNIVLSIIEKKNGFTNKKASQKDSYLRTGTRVYSGFGTLQSINLYLRGIAYKQKGSCAEGVGDASGRGTIKWYGVKSLGYENNYPFNADGTMTVPYEKVERGKKYYYCFAKIGVDGGSYMTNETNVSDRVPLPAYYRIRMFYALELPILDSLVYTVDGKTSVIEKPNRNEISVFQN